VHTLAARRANVDNIAGVQLNRSARQSGYEGLRRSSEARQWGSEDYRSSDYGVLAPYVPVGPFSLPLTRLTLTESRPYSA
jgi:hypothetical protein